MKQITFIEHLEAEFGTINCGWNKFPDGAEEWPFQIIESRDGVFKGISSFFTLGLSNFGLSSLDPTKIIFQELFILMPTDYGFRNIPSVLHDIANSVLISKKALLRGEVFDRFKGIVFEDTGFTSFYVAPPAYFSENFANFDSDERRTTLFWLIPIYEKEKKFIRTNGWEQFEEKIEQMNPDFFDLDRLSLV